MSVKIPEATPPGDYLIRYEIIALHIATTQGGAEFYHVSKGDVTPIQPSDTVSLLGAYSDTDPPYSSQTRYFTEATYVGLGNSLRSEGDITQLNSASVWHDAYVVLITLH